MIVLQKTKNVAFKILNLTDTHMVDTDVPSFHYRSRLHDTTVRALVARTRPDLILNSGDVCWNGQFAAYAHYGELMEEFGLPWSVVWGNHDNEYVPQHVKTAAQYWRAHCPHFVYEDGPAELGNGNFVISLETDGKPVYSIFMADTHDNKTYAGLYPTQVTWLREQIQAQKARGSRDGLLNLHIPIYAYRQAWDDAFSGICDPREVPLADAQIPQYWNEGYRDAVGVCHEPVSASPVEDGVFDCLCQTGMVHTVIAGHDHYNNWMIRRCGVTLAYSLKTGICGGADLSMAGGTLLTIGDGGLTDIRHEYVDVSDFDFAAGCVAVGNRPVNAWEIVHAERSGVERRDDGLAGREKYYHNPAPELKNVYTLPFVVTQGQTLHLDFTARQGGYVAVTLESDFLKKVKSPQYTGDCRAQAIELDGVDFAALRATPVTLAVSLYNADFYGLYFD